MLMQAIASVRTLCTIEGLTRDFSMNFVNEKLLQTNSAHCATKEEVNFQNKIMTQNQYRGTFFHESNAADIAKKKGKLMAVENRQFNHKMSYSERHCKSGNQKYWRYFTHFWKLCGFFVIYISFFHKTYSI